MFVNSIVLIYIVSKKQMFHWFPVKTVFYSLNETADVVACISLLKLSYAS